MSTRLLTSVYKPEMAKVKLTKLFGDELALIEINNSLTDIARITLAAMCDGFFITSSGNNIYADFEVTRAAAIADSLINKFNLPITSKRFETISGTGNKASQSVYFISEEDLEDLLTYPEAVKKINDRKAWGRSERTLNRLVHRFGIDEIESYVSRYRS